jgi:hypothetical protein
MGALDRGAEVLGAPAVEEGRDRAGVVGAEDGPLDRGPPVAARDGSG